MVTTNWQPMTFLFVRSLPVLQRPFWLKIILIIIKLLRFWSGNMMTMETPFISSGALPKVQHCRLCRHRLPARSGAMVKRFFEERIMTKRQVTKLIHEGEYAAEVYIDLITTDDEWSPYLSLEDAYNAPGAASRRPGNGCSPGPGF